MIRLMFIAVASLLSTSCLKLPDSFASALRHFIIPDFKLDLDFPWPQEAVITVNIRIGGEGSVRMDMHDIRSSKLGDEGKKELEEYIRGFKEEGMGEHACSGCTEISYDIGYDANGKLNAYSEGRGPDILVLLKQLSFGRPFRLLQGHSFSYEWNGEVLSVKHGHRAANPPQPKPKANEEPQFTMVIITEGKFISATHGQISDDQKKLVISNATGIDAAKEWGFAIEGLAMRW